MNKQKYFIVFLLLLSGIGLSFYQYFKTLEVEVASATSTVSNPGHLWTQTECNTDSLCVDNTNGILSIKTNTRLGYKLATSGAGLLATNWYRVATFSASNSPTTAKIELSNTSRHQNVIINVYRGTGYYTAEVFEGGRYAYGQNIKNVRIVDMGVNQPTYIDVQVGADETGGTWTAVADVRGTNQILTLNAFVDQGTAAAGHVYPVQSIIRSFGSGTSAGPSFTVTEAGNVGIGTSVPTQKLTVAGGIYSTGYTYMSSNNPTLFFLDTDHNSGMIHMNSNLMYFLSGSGVGAAGWAIHGSYWPLQINMTDDVSVFGGSALFMEGNVGIGTTTPGYTLTVNGTAWVTSGAWSGSDARWKKNVANLSSASSLEKIMALNPVTYEWKVDDYPELKFTEGTQLGFIAQDMEKVIPEVVTTDNDGYKGISYEKIIPVLTSAMQEQQEQIEQLKKIVCIDHPLIEICK
ncbi:MAG: tail fiber domain-containing protein [Bacteroidales bacterium]|jgi:hypothetical protein|nr:tail fiber domain-containing protein [Bacteroidales bacterium]